MQFKELAEKLNKAIASDPDVRAEEITKLIPELRAAIPRVPPEEMRTDLALRLEQVLQVLGDRCPNDRERLRYWQYQLHMGCDVKEFGLYFYSTIDANPLLRQIYVDITDAEIQEICLKAGIDPDKAKDLADAVIQEACLKAGIDPDTLK